MKRRVSSAKKKITRRKELDGDTRQMVSTGSTLLDLAISGGRVKGGGIPGGILVEIFGPSSTGKTVLLCEIAGAVKRGGGEIMFKDPEARLDKEFANMFGMDVDLIDYDVPDLVPEVFRPVRKWSPKDPKVVNGIFADSFAALSTKLEMEDKDQYGMRRAKEFSEELRKTCRTITKKNFLMVASNQVRENIGATQYEQRWNSPGGEGIKFYSSVRLRMIGSSKIYNEKSVFGKQVKQAIGITVRIEVHKNSVWSPYRRAPVSILFDYGIDDIRQNLQYVKDFSPNTIYQVGKIKLDKSLEKSIALVEKRNLEKKLRNKVISVWKEVESKLKITRKKKVR